MLSKPLAAASILTAVLLTGGCNKNDSATPGTPAGSGSSSTATPAASASPAAVTAMAEVAAVYNAVSQVDGHPDEKRSQKLTLKPDGTVELDTTVVEAAKPTAAPKSSDAGTGTFTAGPKEVVATFTTKDGKPTTPVKMSLTRDAGGKALTSEDGRTFEKAK